MVERRLGGSTKKGQTFGRKINLEEMRSEQKLILTNTYKLLISSVNGREYNKTQLA